MPSPLPGARIWRTTLRTLHLLAVAALYGGLVHGVPPERLETAWAWVIGTGVLFTLFEVYRSPVWLVQLRGLATFAKVALLGLAAATGQGLVPTATLVLVVGVATSHMPGRLRYYSLLHGRPIETHEKG